MNEVELLEFGIYHWVIGRGARIPGLLPSGMPSPDFFVPIRHDHERRHLDQISEWIESTLPKWAEGIEAPLLILCSGGVDSSSLVATAANIGVPYELLHTAYTNHDNNDLGKLCCLLEHFPSLSQVISIAEHEYRSGLDMLWQRRLLQNTYGPTITHAICTAHDTRSKILVTGSGPDEFFYGMEKYPFERFRALQGLPIAESLESIDTAYNLDAYRSVLNRRGLELLQEVQEKRRRLYRSLALLCDSIYDAQRMLAYCTVTSQHISMFETLAGLNQMTHLAPFMDEELIKIVFSVRVQAMLKPNTNETSVEIGKHHLKQFLVRYMPEGHVHSRKIGFHAPVTRFMTSQAFAANFDKIMNGSLPDFFDPDKARLLLSERLGRFRHAPPTDYFLYSILNVSEYAMRGN